MIRVYKKIYEAEELANSTRIAQDAQEIVESIKDDEKYTDKINNLMADVNSNLKSFMQKRNYIQQPDVEDFSVAVQKVCNNMLSKTPDVGSVLVSLCLLLSYKLKKVEQSDTEAQEDDSTKDK